MAQARHALTTEILRCIRAAVKRFGEYSYHDKGPSEVMDTGPLMAQFEALPEPEQQQVCRELRKVEYGDTFVEYMLEEYEQHDTPKAPPKSIGMTRLPDFLKGPKE